MNGWVGGWLGGAVGGWMGGWMNEWTDNWMNGWMDGWMDKQTDLHKLFPLFTNAAIFFFKCLSFVIVSIQIHHAWISVQRSMILFVGPT